MKIQFDMRWHPACRPPFPKKYERPHVVGGPRHLTPSVHSMVSRAYRAERPFHHRHMPLRWMLAPAKYGKTLRHLAAFYGTVRR